MSLPPFFSDTKEVYIGKFNRKSQLIYWVILVIIIVTIIILPFAYFDISVKSSGIIRPSSERTEMKSMVSGIIDSIFFEEGQLVEKNVIIAQLQNSNFLSKSVLNQYELSQKNEFIYDLEILTKQDKLSELFIDRLKSPVYKQQITRFIYLQNERETALKKVKRELWIDSTLFADKVISSKEMFDKVLEDEKLHLAHRAFKNDQISSWQQDLAKYRLEFSQLQAQEQQIIQEQKQYEIKASVTGIIQGIYDKYEGGFLQAGEALCVISPETNLIAECYVLTQDVGLLKLNQPVKFQVDAFDYNYFGIVTGRIMSIDNDYSLVDNKPLYKVRCVLDPAQLLLKNGFAGQLKKGLTLQAHFIVARRSAWQLLFDKVDDWLNPSTSVKI